MIFIRVLASMIVVMGALAAPAWAINKCTNASGEVVFQDMPCLGKGEMLKVSPSSGHASETAPDAVSKMNTETQTRKWRETVNQAIFRHVPLVGMSRKDLDDAMGSPTTVNASNYSGVLKDQIIYRQSTQTWYVYTDQGVVSSIQNVPGTNVAAESNSAKAVRCLSNHEIRGMETSASSLTLGDAERAERWKQIGDAKKCGK